MSQEVGKPYQLFMHHVSTKIPKHLILQFQVGIGRQQHSARVKGCLNSYFPEPILSISSHPKNERNYWSLGRVKFGKSVITKLPCLDDEH